MKVNADVLLPLLLDYLHNPYLIQHFQILYQVSLFFQDETCFHPELTDFNRLLAVD